jgi:hypothetical protein
VSSARVVLTLLSLLIACACARNHPDETAADQRGSLAVPGVAGDGSPSISSHTTSAARVEVAAAGGASMDAREAIQDAGARDAAVDTNAMIRQPRVPARHRSAGSTCLAERGPGVDVPQCADGEHVAMPGCVHDADCTNGTRGRCLAYGGPACATGCAYDTCTSDSDCPSNQPCECRSSASSAQPNSCVTEGNCRVDADCGAGGYCSPSVVGGVGSCYGPATCWPDAGACSMYTPDSGWRNVPCSCQVSCGHGYFCHNPSDTCIDDADCGGGGTCNYDTEAKHWSCSTYVGPL